jgi:hypothetical protein
MTDPPTDAQLDVQLDVVPAKANATLRAYVERHSSHRELLAHLMEQTPYMLPEIRWKPITSSLQDGFVGGVCAFTIYPSGNGIQLHPLLPGPCGKRACEPFASPEAAQERAREILVEFLAQFREERRP